MANEWIGPDRVTGDYFVELSMAVDTDGHVHIAGAYWGDDGIWYLTNASGSWTRELLTSAPADGYDGEPSLVIRDDGSIAIAFSRFGGLFCAFGCNPEDPQGIFLVTNRGGSWSEAVRIVEGRVEEPSLVAAGDRLHLAYSRGDEDRTVEYAVSDADAATWTSAIVGEGRAPSLQVAGDGLARIAYQNFGPGRGDLHYAVQAVSGEFVVELVEIDGYASEPLLALSPTDEPHIVFFNGIEDQDDPMCGALSIRQTAGAWSDASIVFEGADHFCSLRAQMIDTDSAGTLHAISPNDLSGDGVWYANDSGGEFRALQLRDLGPHSYSDVPDGPSGIAVDDGGRPHLVYIIGSWEEVPRGEVGVWYGIGPAN